MNEIAFGLGKYIAYAVFFWLAHAVLKKRLSGYGLILAATAAALAVSVLLTGVAFAEGGGPRFIEALAGYGRPAFVIAFVFIAMHYLNSRKALK